MPASLLTSGSPYLDSIIYEAASWRALQSQVQNHSATELTRVLPGGSTSPMYQGPYVKPYHAAVFVEPLLEKTRPSEWTTVSKDDAFMRDLLAAYFTQEYHLMPVFQKDYFLEDMANGELAEKGTPCCSALLVNATLAYACVSIIYLVNNQCF
jgi:hypothetical protein